MMANRINDRMYTFLNGRPVDMPHVTRYITAVSRKWFCPARKAFPFVCLHVSLPYGTFASSHHTVSQQQQHSHVVMVVGQI